MRYTDMKADNIWLQRIANECAETNMLLRKLVDKMFPEPKKEIEGKGAV